MYNAPLTVCSVCKLSYVSDGCTTMAGVPGPLCCTHRSFHTGARRLRAHVFLYIDGCIEFI